MGGAESSTTDALRHPYCTLLGPLCQLFASNGFLLMIPQQFQRIGYEDPREDGEGTEGEAGEENVQDPEKLEHGTSTDDLETNCWKFGRDFRLEVVERFFEFGCEVRVL